MRVHPSVKVVQAPTQELSGTQQEQPQPQQQQQEQLVVVAEMILLS